jgi:nicotinamidase-related amidase
MSLLERVKPGISRRVDFALRRSKCALLVIDIQSYLTYPEHDYFHQIALPRAIQNIEKLAAQFRSIRDASSSSGGCEVLFIYLQSLTKDRRDISLDYKLSGPMLAGIPRLGDSNIFLPECQPDLHCGKGDLLIPKTSCSVFQSTNLDYVLRNLGIEQLVVTGQLTDECVESTVRDGADLGYLMTVAEDACAAISAERHKVGLQGMHGFCRILKSSHIIWEIAECVEASTADTLSLEVLTTFLKERGFADAAMEVAATFAHRTRSPHTSPRAMTDLTDQPTETGSRPDDIVSVTSVAADNLQSPLRVRNSSSRAITIAKHDPREKEATDMHMASTPTKTNVVPDASVVLPRGRDPSILATPDLEQPRSMSSAQYKKRHSADSNTGSSRGSPRKDNAGRQPVARTISDSKRDPPALPREATHIEL